MFVALCNNVFCIQISLRVNRSSFLLVSPSLYLCHGSCFMIVNGHREYSLSLSTQPWPTIGLSVSDGIRCTLGSYSSTRIMTYWVEDMRTLTLVNYTNGPIPTIMTA